MKEYFSVNVSKYDDSKCFCVVRPASLSKPKDNAVMFITESHILEAGAFDNVKHCLVFWPEKVEVPDGIKEKHVVYKCGNPHREYCRFFRDNKIVYLPEKEPYSVVDGAFISNNAVIGKNPIIFPGAYIGGEVVIGDNVYIGAGVKIVGEVYIGNNVIIRENTVIGADGLSTDRESDGSAITMPQFGQIIIEDDVQIGAGTVIARGAIDETRIKRGAKIDSSCFISHNTTVGEDTFIVGETIMFGSSSVGDRCLVSGNCTIANYVQIGNDSTIGMSATVLKNIPENVVAYGSPISTIKNK